MNRIFNMDNGFFRVMGRVADLMILNILFLLCCIPIITIGPAITALYYVTLKMVRNEEAYIIRSFFKSFKENFKQALIIWIFVIIAVVMLFFDFRIISMANDTVLNVLRYVLFALCFIFAMTLSYVFPVLSKFYNSIPATLKNSLLMSIRHLPRTILILFLNIAPVVITLWFPTAMFYGTPLWLILGFAVIAFANSYLFVKIFDNYIPAEEEETVVVEESSDSNLLEDKE